MNRALIGLQALLLASVCIGGPAQAMPAGPARAAIAVGATRRQLVAGRLSIATATGMEQTRHPPWRPPHGRFHRGQARSMGVHHAAGGIRDALAAFMPRGRHRRRTADASVAGDSSRRAAATPPTSAASSRTGRCRSSSARSASSSSSKRQGPRVTLVDDCAPIRRARSVPMAWRSIAATRWMRRWSTISHRRQRDGDRPHPAHAPAVIWCPVRKWRQPCR